MLKRGMNEWRFSSPCMISLQKKRAAGGTGGRLRSNGGEKNKGGVTRSDSFLPRQEAEKSTTSNGRENFKGDVREGKVGNTRRISP